MSTESANLCTVIAVITYLLFLAFPLLKSRTLKLRSAFLKKINNKTPDRGQDPPPEKRRFYSMHRSKGKPKGIPIPTLKVQMQQLVATCQATKSQMVVLIHDNQEIETRAAIVGDDLDLIKLLSDASDKSELIDEILMIISKHYAAKYQSK